VKEPGFAEHTANPIQNSMMPPTPKEEEKEAAEGIKLISSAVMITMIDPSNNITGFMAVIMIFSSVFIFISGL
jgi:hypothetical protein